MSRSSHQQRQMQAHQQQQQTQQQIMADNDAAALATEIFDHFCAAITMRQILGLYRNMCDTIGLRPAPLNDFYPKLKSKIRSWKAQALWKKFDARAVHRAYNKGNACTGTRVLVIGAGPCGLRTAIEAQLLGAKVVVVEKRDRISRNNVLHLWPFLITDLRNLGAKKFYGKFCAGSIDHISIRQLQCIMLKVALLLGVEVHEGVSFENTVEPSDGCGWRAQVSPEDHAVSHYEFDVLIGADGKRNTLEGFRRKEFRGKLAIAITANFINKKTEAEAKVEEISGVAFIFNQSFFKELYQTTGIDLENIVYYKDETHYFVMTAKKHSLIDKGVIMQDFADPAELLAPANVNTEKLLDYAKEAAQFSTKYQMPNLEFAVNHYGKPDVAMFDFTSMFAAEASCRVIVRKNYRLLQCLVGDSLLEPFWPTGSGCARGFLSSMDAAYAIKLWSNPRNSILGVVAQRESIYRLLAQTTPENLQRDIGAYTVDPGTRYPNLNKSTVNVWQVKHLIDSDDPALLEQTFMDTNLIQTLAPETPVRRKRRTGDTLPLSTVLLRWIKAQLQSHEFAQDLNELSECFTGGKVLCTLINRYRPDLVDLNTIKDYSVKERNELAFKILETELGIPRVMSAKDSLNLENIDSKIWLNYLEQICEVFRGEIPHVKHPKLDFFELKERTAINKVPDFSHLFKANAKKSRSPMQDIDMGHIVHRRSILDEEKIRKQRKYGPDFNPVPTDTSRRAKKRRSQEKTGNIEDRQKRLAEIEQNRVDRQSKRRLHRFQQTQNFYKSLHMLQANTFLRESDSSSAFEDYSLYLYRQQAPGFSDRVKELERKLLYPDRERGIASAMPRGNTGDEQFSDRIKSMEQKITSRNAAGIDKKPKDLLRAIGKIESTDWNVREIEKKIEQSKRTETGKSKEKVPKWSKEQFLARQNKMAKADRQQSVDEKFKDIDQTLKSVDKQLKDGSLLEVGERGKNKVASIAGQFVKKDDHSDEKNVPIQKSSSKVGLVFNKQGASEKCHFCKQTVYLMEKISTEGLVLHRSCLKCHHCHTNLRLGAYAFDRDDPVGRFYCTQHFRLPAKAVRPVVRKSMKNQNKSPAEVTNVDKTDEATFKTPDRIRNRPENLVQLDLLDRGQTPERIEFENVDAMSDGEPSQEHIIDENEWTDRNFITESEDAESNISDSDSSDDDMDSDYEEANESPLGAQTLQLATDWIGKQRHSYMDDDSDGDFYDSSEGLLDDDDADSQTEGEEFKKERELRKQEVTVLPPPQYLLTDTETEVVSKGVVEQEDTNNNNDSKSKICNSDKLATDNDDNKNTPTNVNDKISSQTNLTAIGDTSLDKNLHTGKDRSENNDKAETGTSDTSLKRKSRDRGLVDVEFPSGSSESVNSSGSLVPLKNEIKRIDNTSSRPIISGIDALNENLYNLNSFIKLQKDVDNLKRESSVKNDIMKKLSLKEKWLNQDTSGTILNSVNQALRQSKTDLKDTVESETQSIEEQKVASSTTQEDKKEINSRLYEEEKTSKNETKSAENRLDPEELEIEKLVISAMDEIKDDLSKTKIEESNGRDLGKVFYNLENSDRKMSKTLKNIEVKNFADTMDSIKSQITCPTISKQSSVDLSKYFPNQKQEKTESTARNKNQKPLKEVNLSKYFSQSPTEARKSNQSKPATIVTPSSPGSKKRPVPLELFGVTSNGKASSQKRPAPKKPAVGGKRENNSIEQLDGAVDIKQKKVANKNALDVPTGGAVKRRIKPNPPLAKSYHIVKLSDMSPDSDEEIFEEILQQNCSRPSSTEYRRLFDEEKSPSEDVSDKIEKLLEEETRAKQKGEKVNTRKKLTKTRSVGSESRRAKRDPSPKALTRQDSKGDSMEVLTDLEKTMAFLKEGWKTEATRFLENKRDSFFAKRKNGHTEEKPAPVKPVAKPSTSAKSKNTNQGAKKRQEKQPDITDEFSSVTKKYFAKKTQVPIGWKRRERNKVNEPSTSRAQPEPRPAKKEPKKEDAKPKISLHQKYEMLLEETLSSDLSDLSEDVSDKEIDKILDELAQDLEELKEIESKLERKQSLPDVVKSGTIVESALHDVDRSKWTGSLENTREELDLLEKGEIARRASCTETELLLEKVSNNEEKIGGYESEKNENELNENATNDKVQIEDNIEKVDIVKEVTIDEQQLSHDQKIDKVERKSEERHEDVIKDKSPAENYSKIEERVFDTETKEIFKEELKPEKAQTPEQEEHQEGSDLKDVKNNSIDFPEDDSENGIQTEQKKSSSSDRIVPRDRESSSGSLSLSFSFSATSDSGNDKTSVFVGNGTSARKQESNEKNQSPVAKTTEVSTADFKRNSREKTATSEEDSIDALFNQLTDNMLVGVEFDSNDEFVRIIPQGKLHSDVIEKNKIENENASEEFTMDPKIDTTDADSIKYFEICGRDTSSTSPTHFPKKPVRRNKSISSSSTPDTPVVPVRVRKMTLPKLNPVDMAPSVQDILQKAISDREQAPTPTERMKKRRESFPINYIENDDENICEKDRSSVGSHAENVIDSREDFQDDTSSLQVKESINGLKAISAGKPEMHQISRKSQDVTFDNRQEEDAYIEQLEKERRAALRKRDEAYAQENSAVAISVPITIHPVEDDAPLLSSSPMKSSYSSIPPSVASSNDSIPFASTQDLTIPQRPPRRRSIPQNSDEPVDVNTHYLLERSKMLHDRKQNFMNEKMAGNNPYLKQIINEEKRSQDHLDAIGYHDSSIESVELRYPPPARSHHKFPTLQTPYADRGRDRHGSSESIDRGRKTYSLASTLGPRNFVEYFKRTPPKHTEYRRDSSKDRRDTSKDRRGTSKDSCIQTDSESSSPDDIGLNSATEISTDSEFDHDPIYREAPPRIFIDDTHIRKPTRVQVRQGVIHPSQKLSQINNQQQQLIYKQPEIEFKPLVQVDPSVLTSNRTPLKNPRTGDYLLSKAPSTEGIASRKSLELKKRYLLGEQGIGNGIMKSGSTSILDTKLKSFHSNITECQKLLNPSSDIIPCMKTFLEKTKIGITGTESSNIFDLDKKSSDEKENVFVNSQNALNKEKEFVESVNSSIVESKEKKTGNGKVCSPIIETIDLISPEKSVPIIDLTETPSPKVEKNTDKVRASIVDLTVDTSPEKETKDEERTVISEKPDVSKDAKEKIPDIITHIEEKKVEKIIENIETNNEINDTCIEVPTIPWNTKKQNKSDIETDSLSNSSTSSLEDIPHFILDSTTSPETQNGIEQIVPRVEIHDTKGNLMQIDSLMIIDGKYVGDPDDLAHIEMPKDVSVSPAKQETAAVEESKSDTTAKRPSITEVVATPLTIIEVTQPEKPSPVESIKDGNFMYGSIKPDLKFDTKNENKVDTLKNIPLVLEKEEIQRPQKPASLILAKSKSESYVDRDKTPTATEPAISDSETEFTGQVLTETELSDWTADDAVSENFVDIEFALNSNRGTIRRNKKNKKKLSPPKTTSPHKALDSFGPMKAHHIEIRCGNLPNQQKSDCSILKNLNIEEIEFMDTGSEGSCAETYSATNRAMLHTRGYIQVIEHSQKADSANASNTDQNYAKTGMYLQASEKPKEIEGIDYIEQGACILNNEIDLKTPVNETPPLFTSKPCDQVVPATIQSENVNDIDDDSLMYINSQGTGTGTTTTEESEVLTVVLSPLDATRKIGDEPSPSQTASSSDKNERTTSNSSAASKIPVRKSSDERRRQSTDELESAESGLKKRDSEDLSYEEYVRKLQMKITQISNARDSLDIRKQRRKSSKGSGTEIVDSSANVTPNNTVIESNKNFSVFTASVSLDNTAKTSEQPTNAESLASPATQPIVHSSDKPEFPTVTMKLEEITKERTKQKDLIHDLVMDKLQSKKQLNLEKRLIRNRNRSLALGATPSPPPKVSSDYQCSNTPHYHIASAERRNSKSSPSIIDEKDTKPSLSASPSKQIPQSEQMRFNNRPLSDNLEQPSYPPKITKTQSFCVYSTRYVPLKDNAPKSADPYKSANTFVTPHPPPRAFRKLDDTSVSAATEKLRAEARARARLKSNEDLGLSPEEKLQILRKRYHLDLQQALEGTSTNKSDDMKVRERKMVTSKSFNDITAVQGLRNSDENFTMKPTMQMSDCTSDPNINNSSSMIDATKTPTPASRRRKDPERRKSLIQAVSNFFHKRKEKEGSPSTPASPKTDKADGVFSRFKISPKATKEKSKSCFDMRNFGFGDRDESSSCERNKTREFLKNERLTTHSSSPQLYKESSDDLVPPPIPPLPLNYQRSDDESYTTECREQKKQRAISKASRQAELKRLRIAQEIQREQEEIEVKLKELEARGVLIEKALRGEGQDMENLETSSMGASDEKLLKELLEIWRNITQLKKRDEELGIRQKELQLEHRHAQLKEELNSRLSCSKLDKSSADIAAEGAILNEMLEIVAKRAALRPSETTAILRETNNDNHSDI